MTILELIGRRPGGLTNSGISQQMRLATSSCSYILGRLESTGFVVRDDETGKYRLGLRILSLCEGVLRESGLRRILEPALRALSEATQLLSNIGVLERGRVMIVERAESPGFIKVDILIGTRLPVHTTALGKVLMAGLSDDEVQKIVDREGLKRSTSKSIINIRRFMQEIQLVRKQGFARSEEEEFAGVCSIAAPIRDPDGHVLAAVSVVGFASHQIWADSGRVVDLVKTTALRISGDFGHLGWRGFGFRAPES